MGSRQEDYHIHLRHQRSPPACTYTSSAQFFGIALDPPQDGLVYESNYRSGLRIVNASGITEDPMGAGFFEAAFFDVFPEDDAVGGEALGGVPLL
ncbi:Unc-80-like protein [Mycena venus]|uniref:Unc-80-like protein n=1 Tax=Mycena venus TaxID=2733690 RepID=A0A8H7DBI2_9AGAR|nr:Unc-80-like protein [Mycena venus]